MKRSNKRLVNISVKNRNTTSNFLIKNKLYNVNLTLTIRNKQHIKLICRCINLYKFVVLNSEGIVACWERNNPEVW